MQSLVLIEGKDVSEETLTRGVSLQNAKQFVVGSAFGFGTILHIEAESVVDLDNAIRVFSQLAGVTGVLTLAIRTPR